MVKSCEGSIVLVTTALVELFALNSPTLPSNIASFKIINGFTFASTE